MQDTMYVFGHKNPDTDSIMSAIAFAHLLNERGEKAKAVALGEPNAESVFALSHFNMKAPEVIDHVKGLCTRVALVDHNEAQQSVDDRSEVDIAYVIDHHRIANFETAGPLYYRCEPVGCSNTILYEMYQEGGIEIPKDIAGLMLSAIISDTLLGKSPTCTPRDIKAMEALEKIAGVDAKSYGMELLKAGTDLGDKTPEEIIDLDAKSFPMGSSTLRIAQVNTVSLPDFFKDQEAYKKAIEKAIEKEGYDAFVFVVTDILENNSKALVLSSDENLKNKIAEAFGVGYEDETLYLKGVVSRKKQVVPPLQKAIG